MKTTSSLIYLGFASSLALTMATTTSFNADFDDLIVIPEESRLNPVGIYKNISFINFGANQPGAANESLNGVMPHSEPNQAVLTGTPANMTISYTGSKIKSLSLSSFYYGCSAALGEGVVDFAIACTITATGYKAGSNTAAANQEFSFTPAQPLDVMNAPSFGQFSSKFQGLETVAFVVAPATTAGGVVDDIVGSLTS